MVSEPATSGKDQDKGREELILELSAQNKELRDTQEALKESEEKFRILTETSPAMIFFHQGESFLYVNPIAEEVTGYSRDELLGMDFWELMSPEYQGIVRERGRSRLRGEDPIPRYTVKIVTKQGEEKWLELSSARMTYKGKPSIMATATDVTERKRAEEALKLDEVRLEALVEMNEARASSPGDVIQLGLDKGVKLTGSSMGFFNIMTPDEKYVEVYVNTGNIMAMGNLWPRSLSIEKGGLWTSIFKSRKPLVVNDYPGSHPEKKGLPQGHEPLVKLMGVPVFEDDRIVAVFMVANKASDYTDADVRQLGLLGNGIWKTYARMKAEEQLKISKEQAELYLDLMGHDINNIHQAALGYLELARDMPGDAREEYLDNAIEALRRSTRLIKNVRKLQNFKDIRYIHDVDVCSVLVDVYREYASTGKTVALDLRGNMHCHVRADDLLRDVFSNLVGNAIKHTGDHALISISLDVVREKGVEFCRVFVEDDGPGIPDESKKTLFKRSLKGTPRAKGMGLGLYLVKTLVENYGGRVWVEDRVPGDHTKGARFVVMLPAIENG